MPMRKQILIFSRAQFFLLRFRKDGLENTGSGKFHVRIDQGVYLSY